MKSSYPFFEAANHLHRFTACLAFFCSALFAGPLTAQDFPVKPDDLPKIDAALPANAAVTPLKPRRLLIFTLNVGYGGHPSIGYANEAFARMGRKTGAFETVVTNDPAVFARDSLARFDAVFFNNTVGNCFTNLQLRRNLQEFISGGGGLMGVHGTTVAFTKWPGAIEDWPEFGYMIGGRGANHKASDEQIVMKLDDPEHPLNQPFAGSSFTYSDEFFRVQDPYSRKRLRILFSMDTKQSDPQAGKPLGNTFRADNDYAFAWVRNYGRGRSFYCTIAHNPRVFYDPKMLEFYLRAIQFALGDLKAPTTPSARLSPAVMAQEKLGWKLGVEAYTFHKFTLSEAIDKTAQLGLCYIGGLSFQKTSTEIPRNFEPSLSDEELEQVRLKLEAAGLRMLTYYIQELPADPAECRKVFEFGRKMGIETFISEPKLDALSTIEQLCDEYGINVALHNHDAKASPVYWRPEGVLEAVKGRSKRLGACADIGYWIRSGLDPIEGLRKLGDRLTTIQVHDLNDSSRDGHDVPWGSGTSHLSDVFGEMKRLGQQPTMIGLEYSYDWMESLPKIEQSIAFFNSLTLPSSK